MNKKQIRPFGVKDEIGYVFGDMAGSFVNLFVDAYFLIFCTSVLGISAGWMGTLFLVARLWDAINDPIMGSFPDRWMIGKPYDSYDRSTDTSCSGKLTSLDRIITYNAGHRTKWHGSSCVAHSIQNICKCYISMKCNTFQRNI